ncbi:MAG: hypothetical protein D8M28_02785 [Proteobacteria bacterium]|nr:hypothetical protein [Pseudomonadota bacterium]
MGQEWRERMGMDNKTRFEVDPSKADGLGEKLWDKGMVGIAFILLFPFILLFRFFAGPFRKDLRWPRLTRLSFILAIGGLYCLNISPSFHRLEKKIGKLMTLPLEMSYLFFLVAGALAIPAYLVLLFFRSKPNS